MAWHLRSRVWSWLFPLLLLAGLAAAYRRAVPAPFVFDDIPSIVRNRSLATLATAFSPPPDTTVSGRPVVNLSLALNRALSGPGPSGYRLGNLVIHAGAALLLFGFVRRAFRRLGGEWEGQADLIAASVAWVWALHPLLTEAVTYIIQRAECLMAFFYLAVLYGVVRSAEPGLSRAGRCSWGGVAVAACWLGMGSKEVMVSAPILALALDRACLAGSWRGALRERGVLHGLMAASWIFLGVLVASTHGRSGTAGLSMPVPLGSFYLTQLYGVVHYVRLAFAPWPLIFDYGTFWADRTAQWLPAAILIAAAAGIGLWGFVRNRPWAWPVAWFFAILAPTSLTPGSRQTLAEQRMYLALAPVVLLAAAMLFRGLGRRAALLLGVAGAALGAATFARNQAYRSNVALWSDNLRKCPDSGYAENNLGEALLAEKRDAEAAPHLVRAVELQPGYGEAWVNLAVCEEHFGRIDQAERCLRRAIALLPRSAAAHSDYGNLLRGRGRLPEAAADLQEAVVRDPAFAEARNNLGNVLSDLGQSREAEGQFRRAVALAPSYADAYNGLGSVLLQEGRLGEAQAAFASALRLDPKLAAAHANEADLLARQGHSDDAEREFRRAEELDSSSASIRFNHGNLLLREGRTAEAAAAYRAALRLNPRLAAAQGNLGVALFREGRPGEALAAFEAAARADPHLAGIQGNIEAARQAMASHP